MKWKWDMERRLFFSTKVTQGPPWGSGRAPAEQMKKRLSLGCKNNLGCVNCNCTGIYRDLNVTTNSRDPRLNPRKEEETQEMDNNQDEPMDISDGEIPISDGDIGDGGPSLVNSESDYSVSSQSSRTPSLYSVSEWSAWSDFSQDQDGPQDDRYRDFSHDDPQDGQEQDYPQDEQEHYDPEDEQEQYDPEDEQYEQEQDDRDRYQSDESEFDVVRYVEETDEEEVEDYLSYLQTHRTLQMKEYRRRVKADEKNCLTMKRFYQYRFDPSLSSKSLWTEWAKIEPKLNEPKNGKDGYEGIRKPLTRKDIEGNYAKLMKFRHFQEYLDTLDNHQDKVNTIDHRLSVLEGEMKRLRNHIRKIEVEKMQQNDTIDALMKRQEALDGRRCRLRRYTI